MEDRNYVSLFNRTKSKLSRKKFTRNSSPTNLEYKPHGLMAEDNDVC